LEEKGKQAFPGQGRVPPEQEQVQKLERQVEILRQERDILKKQWPSSRAQADEIPIQQRSPGRVPGCSYARAARCLA
ncbi:MAG: hypothetical protein U9Q70_03715, partial [Chloroflexota bacterium]|nr:hypothetical protein [Chloroflexota bacterium]